MNSKIKPSLAKRERISTLRSYYQTHSPMVLDRDLAPWKCHRSKLLYAQGWKASESAPTLRMRRSMAEAYMLERLQPVILPGELIVGQPDFHPFSPEEQAFWDTGYQDTIPPYRGRADHLAMDYTILLEKGVDGLLAQVQEKIDAMDLTDGRTVETYEFYRCCQIELQGLCTLADGYAAAARALAAESQGAQREEYASLAKCLEQVPRREARTFREALQSIHLFTYSLFGIYSAGRPDQYLYPYYTRDLERGIMTEEDAQELIDCFCLQYMNNMSAWAAASFMLGGRDGDGAPVENQLTWHFLAAIAHNHTPDPNVGFCVTPETSPEIMAYVVSLIKDGHGQPQIWNNDAVTASMLANGYDPKAANLFTNSTCVEVTPIGCSGVSITSPYVNMLKIFLEAFDRCTDAMDFDEIYDQYAAAFESYCREAALQENLWQLERRRNATDPARISVLIHDCLERGLSNESGGAVYNYIMPNMLGMTNVIESLNVIRRLVFQEKRLTVSQFQAALRANYEGYEDLRAYIIHKVEHFGTGGEETNRLAKRVADLVVDTFGKFTSYRGAAFIPGAFSYRDHEINGQATPASPDGRLAGTTLADGSSPVQGYDNLGPTLSLHATAAWQPSRFLGGISVNVKLNSQTPAQVIQELIDGYIRENGMQLQFNIVDRETLKKAQACPDQYQDLLVRIGGYSDYFVRIPKALQEDVIARAQN